METQGKVTARLAERLTGMGLDGSTVSFWTPDAPANAHTLVVQQLFEELVEVATSRAVERLHAARPTTLRERAARALEQLGSEAFHLAARLR